MATLIKIPSAWIENRPEIDINAFLTTRGFTVKGRNKDKALWIIEIEENLNVGQQTALRLDLERSYNEITFEII